MAMYRKTTCLEFKEEEGFKSMLADRLSNQRQQGLYCDLHLIIDGHAIPVHKGVLVAKCDYFAAMFGHSFCEDSAQSVDMSHVFPSVTTAETIIDYMYTGRVLINEDTIDDVLQSASHLLLESLGRHCAQYLLSNLGPHNCVHTWAVAEAYSMPELALIAKNMTKSKFQEFIINQEESLRIPGEFLLKIVQEAMPQIYNADLVMRFFLNWTKFEQSEEKIDALKEILDLKPELTRQGEKSVEELIKSSPQSDTSLCVSVSHGLRSSSSTTEVLVSYITSTSSHSSDFRMHIYVYIPMFHKWACLGTIFTSLPFFSTQCELVGATGDSLIFKAQNPHRLLSMTLANRENEEIHFPERHLDSVGLVTYKQFCFDQQVFCIVEDERRTRFSHKRRPSRTLSEGDFVTVRSLLVYDHTSQTWIFCCEIPLVGQSNGQQAAALDYHIIDVGDCAYIWAMDMYWHESGRGGGPFWMKLYSHNQAELFNYRVSLETCPPVTSQEWGYKQVKLVGSEEGVLVYGYSHHCNMCTPMLLYNKHTKQWSAQEELVIHYPHVVLPLLGGNFRPETVHISQNTNVQCLSAGLLFHLEDICPYVSRFWALDIEKIEWQELPAPPVTGLRNFTVCRINSSLLNHCQNTSWFSSSDLPEEGPLLHCRLPDGASYFRPVTPSCSCESTSEDEQNYYILGRGQESELSSVLGSDDEEESEPDLFYDALSDI